jgi:hypothetical protein
MRARAVALLVALAITGGSAARAQTPATRAEALREQRAEKARHVEPYEPGAVEKGLLALENGRFFERLLHPPEGFYPKIGHITPGSSLSLGPGYRKPRLFDRRAVFSAAAIGSLAKYWLLDARLLVPDLAGGTGFVEMYGQRYDWPREAFFGLGPASLRREQSDYGLRNTVVGMHGGLRLTPLLSVGGRVERLTPRLRRGAAPGIPAVQDLFLEEQVAGLGEQPDFNRYELFADLNFREPRGNPRRGGRYLLTLAAFDDRDLARYSFRRFELDLQQYVPLLNERRVIALRALASSSDAGLGQSVPFYLMRTLGGPDDLRGFRLHRFRDANLLLLQLEYRWEVMTAIDAAIFADAGQVAPRFGEISMRRFEKDYGFGVRFGSANGVFLRVEGAFGSRDGKHLVVRFGNVF